MITAPLPYWFKIAYTALALVVFVLYWREYGPANFLWFSDIAFFGMAYAIWRDDALFSSMMAIGVLPLECVWVASYLSGFLTGGQTWLGVGDYMFDDTLALWLRGLSLFHFPMIIAVVHMLLRRGYDPRALVPQVVLAMSVLVLTHMWGIKADNPNMIYPPGALAALISQPLYSALQPLVLVMGVILPMHLLLKKYLPLRGRA